MVIKMSKKKVNRQRKLRRKERGLKPKTPDYIIKIREKRKMKELKEMTFEELEKKIFN